MATFAYSQSLKEGYLNLQSSEASNTISQFYAVCFDTTTPNGVVRPDNGNAGAVIGVNLSTGYDSNANPVSAVQPGADVRAGVLGIYPMSCAAVNILAGQKLYTTSALQGQVTNVSTAAKFVGYAMQASAGNAGDIIAVFVCAFSQN